VVTSWLFLPTYVGAFQAGFFVLALADSAAALVGKRCGTHRYVSRGDSLSYEGSLTFLVVTVGVLLYTGMSGVYVLASACAITLLEAVAPLGSDNLVLPLATGLLVRSFLVG
jgi:dolichol kinase